ncbi:Ctr copper transporter family-domain-containing protein [Xylariaceae sp. FL0804]|nr:Ctr copper transporter family-domain-containing protein [Xylariaceae sp. FL0804]
MLWPRYSANPAGMSSTGSSSDTSSSSGGGMDMGDMGSMPGMDMGSSSSSSSSTNSSSGSAMLGMQVMGVFQSTVATPLYSMAWTPTTSGEYTGTLVFLVALAVVLRLLLAAKTAAEARWLHAELRRGHHHQVVAPGQQDGRGGADKLVGRDGFTRSLVMSESGSVEDDLVVVSRSRAGPARRPWSLSVDPLRAVLDTCITGVAYLLMLAVMTMNVGYFIAVLTGTFLGSLLVGRYAGTIEH